MQINQLLRASFKPEFLNRIDEIIMFKPLDRDVQMKIVHKLLNELKARLENNNIKMTFTDELCQYVLDQSYNTIYGARPIKRFIQKNVETLIAKDIVASKVVPNKEYTVTYENNEIVVK